MIYQEKARQETQFFSMLSLIANKHGLELKIDPDTRNIDLIGDVDRLIVAQCAIEIGEMAKSYKEIMQ